MSSHESFDTDVLIIGAGPVGLTLATALQRSGTRFRIIDGKNAPEQFSKAANLWPRTQEVFAALGVLDRLTRESSPLHSVALHAYGKALGHVRMDNNDSPYPTPLFVGQNVIERELCDHLTQVGVNVERGGKAVQLYTDGRGVSVEVERDGERETIMAKYAAGCDGSSGFTRKQVGLDFEPARLEGRILRQVDARVRWSRPVQVGIANFFLGDDEYLGYLPLPGGHDRIFVVTPDAGVPDRTPTVQEMQEVVRKVTGDNDVELSDPVWLTRGRLNHGVAKAFQSGRILLAGDAGHMTIPVYGQGMNTGMQDAYNLAWKLKIAVDHEVPGLLESYSQERHQVRAALDREQGTILQRAAYPGTLQKFLLPLLGPIALARGAGQHFRDRSTQLKVSYRDSSMSVRNKKHSGLGAGDRAPDATVVRAHDLTTVTLFETLYRGGWTLLYFEEASTMDAGAQVKEVTELAAMYSELSVLYVRSERTRALGIEDYLDVERYARKAYQLGTSEALMLVRPDGYIGFSSHQHDLEALAAYFQRWLA